jgi:hypothetical protein
MFSHVFYYTDAGCGHWGGIFDLSILLKTLWTRYIPNQHISAFRTHSDETWINTVAPPQNPYQWHSHNDTSNPLFLSDKTFIVFTGGERFDDASRVRVLYQMCKQRVCRNLRYDLVDIGMHGYSNCDADEIQFILKHALYIGVRNKYSKKICKKIFGCKAHLWNPPVENILEYEYIPSRNTTQIHIGLAVGNRDFHSNYDNTQDRFFAVVGKTNTYLLSQGYSVVWHGIVTCVSNDSDPHLYNDSLVFQALREKTGIDIQYRIPTCVAEYLNQFHVFTSTDISLDMVISASRLHSMELANRLGIPSIGYYLHDPIRHKYESYCREHPSVSVVLDHLGDLEDASTLSATSLAETIVVQLQYKRNSTHPSTFASRLMKCFFL